MDSVAVIKLETRNWFWNYLSVLNASKIQKQKTEKQPVAGTNIRQVQAEIQIQISMSHPN